MVEYWAKYLAANWVGQMADCLASCLVVWLAFAKVVWSVDQLVAYLVVHWAAYWVVRLVVLSADN